MPTTLTESQLAEIEAGFPEGLTSGQLVRAFSEHRVRFSEANLRRYVQLGLVPRSRRIGAKGKHLGSRGVYPIRAVRRINEIKRLMAERYTLEEIQARFLTFKDGLDRLEEILADLQGAFRRRVESEGPGARRELLVAEFEAVLSASTHLLDGVQRLERLLVAPGGRATRRTGGAADPTELL